MPGCLTPVQTTPGCKGRKFGPARIPSPRRRTLCSSQARFPTAGQYDGRANSPRDAHLPSQAPFPTAGQYLPHRECCLRALPAEVAGLQRLLSLLLQRARCTSNCVRCLESVLLQGASRGGARRPPLHAPCTPGHPPCTWPYVAIHCRAWPPVPAGGGKGLATSRAGRSGARTHSKGGEYDEEAGEKEGRSRASRDDPAPEPAGRVGNREPKMRRGDPERGSTILLPLSRSGRGGEKATGRLPSWSPIRAAPRW